MYAPVGLMSCGTFGGSSGQTSSGMLRNIGWSRKSDCHVWGTCAVGQRPASNRAPWKPAGTSSGRSTIFSRQAPLSDVIHGDRAACSVTSAIAVRRSP